MSLAREWLVVWIRENPSMKHDMPYIIEKLKRQGFYINGKNFKELGSELKVMA